MKPLEGKVAIVTGGGAGIGQALCEELANRGSKVVVADIDEDRANKVVAAIMERGGQAQAAHLDVSKDEEVKRLVDGTVSENGRLDYMFNNAGIVIGGEARDLTLDQWRRTLDVDFNGVLFGTLAAYSIMVKQGSGHIVNTSSVAGLMPQPRNAPYSTAKHAIVGLSLSLRLEGADLGVKVTVVCPGFVRTNIYQNAVVANASKDAVVAPAQRKMVEAPEAARLILEGAARNQAIIVFPSRIRWTWRLYRLFPGVVDRTMRNRMRNFREQRSTSATAG